MLLFHPIYSIERNHAAKNIISLNERRTVNLSHDGRESNGRLELERNALRLLCSVLLKPGTRLEICTLLDPAVFHDPLWRIIFEEVHALGAVESRRLRELLPARITNRGFPEFDLHEFLAPHEVNEAEIDKLFEGMLQLLDQSHPDEEQFAE